MMEIKKRVYEKQKMADLNEIKTELEAIKDQLESFEESFNTRLNELIEVLKNKK